MTAKVSELEGDRLDYWVGRSTFAHPDNLTGDLKDYYSDDMKINNDIVAVIDDECGYSNPIWSGAWKGRLGWMRYYPSTNWAQGGKLIEAHHIDIEHYGDGDDKEWMASIFNPRAAGAIRLLGATPLIAAMRCIVSSKYGEEVEDD